MRWAIRLTYEQRAPSGRGADNEAVVPAAMVGFRVGLRSAADRCCLVALTDWALSSPSWPHGRCHWNH